MVRLRELYRANRCFRWAAELLLLVALVTAVGAWQTRHLLSGVPLPQFELEQVGGGHLSSASLQGQPAMVVLWAPWCSVCAAQADNVARVARWASARGRVVSIALEYRARSEVDAHALSHGVGGPVLYGTEALGQALRVESFPTVYFVDAKGRVTYAAVGYTTTLGLWWRLLCS